MSDRDDRGRFISGNKLSSAGGQKRAEKLPAFRRREIAKSGFRAMVERHFGGDVARANRWLAAKGQFVTDPFPQNGVFQDPGPHPAHRS